MFVVRKSLCEFRGIWVNNCSTLIMLPDPVVDGGFGSVGVKGWECGIKQLYSILCK